MKDLMQHLLDGGKLVDDDGGNTYCLNNKYLSCRNSDGVEVAGISNIKTFVALLAGRTVEKLVTYEDGLYWVYWSEAPAPRRLGKLHEGQWMQIDFVFEPQEFKPCDPPFKVIDPA